MKHPFKCPVCAGSGKVSRPPDVAGDVGDFISSVAGPWPCPACKGECVLWHSDEPDPIQIEDRDGDGFFVPKGSPYAEIESAELAELKRKLERLEVRPFLPTQDEKQNP